MKMRSFMTLFLSVINNTNIKDNFCDFIVSTKLTPGVLERLIQKQWKMGFTVPTINHFFLCEVQWYLANFLMETPISNFLSNSMS